MIIRHPEKVNKPSNPIKKKPEWIRSKIIDSQNFFLTKSIINNYIPFREQNSTLYYSLAYFFTQFFSLSNRLGL